MTIEIASAGTPANTYFDNVGVVTVAQRNETALTVCRDLTRRRNIIATPESLHQVTANNVSRIGPVPFTPGAVVARDATIGIISGAQAAVSEDNGSTFSKIALPSDASQIIAEPRLVVVLMDGTILGISGGSTNALSTIAAGSFVAFDARRQEWIATDQAGNVSTSPDLVAWTVAKAMPIGGTAYRAILPTDIGRLVGYAETSRDLFYSEAPTEKWTLGRSLADPILQLEEVK
ncbi:hypothetical protein BMI91_19585 [Thioclava sediminum]|uniref:Uncharacterized protein n=1 Tax=Thioclava sediminum TaxID=1915319 RepID=A0ABX3MSW0_9RHOB|nr:hypothetical protein BMI91_19585 [Thioclava sediminum]